MIIKKMPILKGFLSLEYVKKLSNFVSFSCGDNPVFYDIETTGLSRYSTFLYLIGAAVWENGNWSLYQWMTEREEEEKALLCTFSDFIKSATCTIQYNGNKFDEPYLKERYKIHNLPCPLIHLPALDLYQELFSCKKLLMLSKMKQPDLENFLGINTRACCDGRECIRLYRTYSRNPDPNLLKMITGHNQEDLAGLGAIYSMLAYRALFTGIYEPLTASVEKAELLIRFTLPFSVPAPVSKKGNGYYFSCEGTKGALLAEVKDKRIRMYYPDYKNYDYIPREDAAIPKVLSRYMDKGSRQAARPETCYTWIFCDESFLKDKKKQKQYLNHTVPCLLNLN